MNFKKSVLSIAFVFVVLVLAIEVSALAGNDSVRYPQTNILQYRSHTLFDTGVISEASSLSSPMPEKRLSSPITGGGPGQGKNSLDRQRSSERCRTARRHEWKW